HGLPIEHKVEKKICKIGKKISSKEFRTYCRQYAEQQVKKQKTDFIRLGVLANWNEPYLTMDFKNEANIIRSLAKIIKNNYLYKDFRPVHWCTDCTSALSEAEVEYYNKTSPSIIVQLQAKNIDMIKKIFNVNEEFKIVHIIIWTTTPWTLPASRAITLHPHLKYQLIKIKDNTIILAKKLVKSIMKKIGSTDWKIIATIEGKKLEYLEFFHPFLHFSIPIITSTHVISDTGTGAVHTAPDYGQDDYDVSKKYNIHLTHIIDEKGFFKNDIHPVLNNINILKANDLIIKLLNENNKLLSYSDISHSYPHCWRHKIPIISRATPQWFINIDAHNLREKSIKAIHNVRWIPGWGENRMESMISNRPHWCISRQRTWGVPITLFTHKKTGKLHPKTIFLIEQIAKKIEIYGIQAWWDLRLQDLIQKDVKDYVKTTDILDVWFESGSITTSNTYKQSLITDQNAHLYLEGIDQYRGWFMSSLMISMAITNHTPYHEVIAHGFTVDENGRKMSKSINNTISPNTIINTLGADILRLWVASSDYSSEILISEKILKQSSDNYRKIRNTSRFFLANLYEFNPEQDLIDSKTMLSLDQWAVSTTLTAQNKIIKLYQKYKFHEIIQIIIYFCSIEMGSFYLDIIKDRLYTTKKNSHARKSCQTAIYLILQAFVRWIAPILSFTANEIWDYLPGKKNKYVFTEEWFSGLSNLDENVFLNNKYWYNLIEIKNEVNLILEHSRLKKIIGNSLEASITLYVDNIIADQLNFLGQELKFLFITSEIIIKNYKDAPNTAIKSKKIKNLKIDFKKMIGKKCI
ncbi:MAG TPA: isoleucine--tRNA ligase, partial [Buchnera sp. (in: enterobacteria)]|nr:isoleucine--tRNA ligase [Buchnera sp. (in: enterobacteria)]